MALGESVSCWRMSSVHCVFRWWFLSPEIWFPLWLVNRRWSAAYFPVMCPITYHPRLASAPPILMSAPLATCLWWISLTGSLSPSLPPFFLPSFPSSPSLLFLALSAPLLHTPTPHSQQVAKAGLEVTAFLPEPSEGGDYRQGSHSGTPSWQWRASGTLTLEAQCHDVRCWPFLTSLSSTALLLLWLLL